MTSKQNSGGRRPSLVALAVKAETVGIVTGLMVVAAIVLLATSVNFGIPGQPILGTLRFHLAIPMLVLPMALFLLGAWWRGLVSLLLVGASLAQGMIIIVGLHEARAPLEARVPAAELTVMSFNVLANNPTAAMAREAIVAREPDIAVIMETPGIERYLNELATTFPWRAGCQDAWTCDLSILSRTPLTGVQVIKLGPLQRERLVIAQTAIDGVALTVVGLHLSKPYYDDLAVEELAHALTFLTRLEGPVVLTGDFNAAPWSGAVAGFAEAAKLIPPPAHPATWPVELGGLGIPIDNMFTQGPALITSIAEQPSYGSNHLGLLARVSLFAAP